MDIESEFLNYYKRKLKNHSRKKITMNKWTEENCREESKKI